MAPGDHLVWRNRAADARPDRLVSVREDDAGDPEGPAPQEGKTGAHTMSMALRQAVVSSHESHHSGARPSATVGDLGQRA